jgi:hypothetical protein
MRRRERQALLWRPTTANRGSQQTGRSQTTFLAEDPRIPLRQAVEIEPSPTGSDDVARIIAVVAFNGVCRLITALASSGNLSRVELEGLHDAMTDPLDNPEVRDDEVIACARDTLETILSNALVELDDHDRV